MNYEKILWLKDKYINKTIVIIGCGTSLLDFDLNKIRKDIHIFTFIRFLQFFNYFWKDLKINSYLCHDRFTLFEPFSFFLKKKFIHLKLNFDEYEGIKEKYKECFNLPLYDIILKEYFEISDNLFFAGHSNGVPDEKQINDEWYKKLKQYSLNKKFHFYKINNYDNSYDLIKKNKEASIGNPCVGSICSPILPIINHLGFKEIYLAGIDFSDKGYFFFQQKNLTDFRQVEFDYFNEIIKFLINKNKKVYAVQHNDTLIKNNFKTIDFSDLT